MFRNTIFVATAILILSGITTAAEDRIADMSFSPLEEKNKSGLYSPQSAETFFNISCEILEPEDVSIQEAKEAVMMLKAAEKLDKSINTMLPQILKAASVDFRVDYSRLVRSQLYKYVSATSDAELAMKGVTYLLSKVNTREQREAILQSLSQDLGSSNEQFSSQISTYLGILAAETADFKSAATHFLDAYNSNPYNVVAFEKLGEVSPDFVTVPLMGPYLRRKITLNPYSLELALDFADYAYQYGLFEEARGTYQYAAEVYEYQNPEQPIPERVYLPWIMSAYNVEFGEANTLKIVNKIREQGSFNLAVEYISIMSEPLSASQRKTRLANLSQTATQMLATGHPGVNEQGLTYFYAFMDPDNRLAADMAKRAYAKNSDSIDVKSLYAYTLLQSGDINTAEEMVEIMKDYNQIAAYTYALVQYEKSDIASSLATLRQIVAMEPGSFVARMALERLEGAGSEYVPENDPYALRQLLDTNFGDSKMPQFYKPEDVITTKVSLSGVEFGYGADLGLYVVISNNGRQPLVITDNSFFRGEIFIRVRISGDIEGIKPIEIRKRVTPVSPIKPGGTLCIPVYLNTEATRLDKILRDFPQANLILTFQAYFDPQIDDQGQISSKIPMAITSGKRLGVILTKELMAKRIDNLRSGQAGQKLNTIKLINGLIAEQRAAEKYGVLYRHKAIPEDMLEEAFNITFDEDNWQVRFLMLDVLRNAGETFEAQEKFSAALQDTQWPIRMISLYGLSNLSQGEDFQKVLNWMYQSDEQELIRELAAVEGANTGMMNEQ
jgi:tetratricopeptide (TPR) repeat protein